MTLHAPVTLTGITPEHGHAAAAAVHTVTVQEDVQGDAEDPLIRLIDKSTDAVAASVRITEYRFPPCGTLIDPASEVVGYPQEQQRQPGEHGMHQGMPGHVRQILLPFCPLSLQPHPLRRVLTLLWRQHV